MNKIERRALNAERESILKTVREAVRANCHTSCFRNPDGSPAHPVIVRLDQINAMLEKA